MIKPIANSNKMHLLLRILEKRSFAILYDSISDTSNIPNFGDA